MTAKYLVTIDGPAASGKTSVSRALANHFSWSWVSTGTFYRGLSLVALKEGLDLNSEDPLVDLALSPIWQVKMASEQTLFFYREKDFTNSLGATQVGLAASKVSQYSKVRHALLQPQRDCLKGVSGLIAEGRDCGTVIFPQALVKIYLTARQEDRAQRRALELGVDEKKMQEVQAQRDQADTQRKAAPLQIPEHALVVDTSALTFEQVIKRLSEHISSKLGIVGH